MFPALHLWGLTLNTYGLSLLTGSMLGIFWAIKRAPETLKPAMTEASAFYIYLAMLGAKIWDWILNTHIQLTYYGVSMAGLALGFALIIPVYGMVRPKAPLTAIMDLAAPSAALLMGFAKIGCFLHGCCLGHPSQLPWAVHFPHEPEVGRHPVQMYESVLMFLLSFILLKVNQHKTWDGKTTGLFFTVFGIVHFTLEYLRPDHQPFWWGTSLNQIGCLLLALFGFAWYWKKRASLKNPSPLSV